MTESDTARFAFLVSPRDRLELVQAYGLLRYVPRFMDSWLTAYMSPTIVSHISGVVSEHSGARAEGWIIALPATRTSLARLPERTRAKKGQQAIAIADRLGASVFGSKRDEWLQHGLTTLRGSGKISLLTTAPYRIGTGVRALLAAACQNDGNPDRAELVVLGADTPVGSVAAQLLAREARYLTLVGRSDSQLRHVAQQIRATVGLAAGVSRDSGAVLQRADVVVLATETDSMDNLAHELKTGSALWEVAESNNATADRLAGERRDICVVQEALVKVPGPAQAKPPLVYPRGTVPPGLAMTMASALEWGSAGFPADEQLSVKQVETICGEAEKHGFVVVGYRRNVGKRQPVDIRTHGVE